MVVLESAVEIAILVPDGKTAELIPEEGNPELGYTGSELTPVDEGTIKVD